MTADKLFLGVDWGTHSSKWACLHRGYLPVFPLHSSDLLREGTTLTFSPPEETATNEDNVIRSLKGILINDPRGSSFWDAAREDTNTSLGEAVAYSLCSIMIDAGEQIAAKSGITDVNRLEVGFSFPNWLVDKRRQFRTAAKNFSAAVAVAVDLFVREPHEDLPRPGKPFSISLWRDLVRKARERTGSPVEGELDIENITQQCYSLPESGIQWRFITESGAAGLPYLRAMEIEYVPGAPGLAKLLVIDVGAGSTDVGYMLRVQNRDTGGEKLYYFRPASSFPVAGNYLTEEIMKFYAARNEPLTHQQAEARKLQQTTWHTHQFVDMWRSRICQHVSEYLEGVPDERWLPLPVSLNVVVTGGSGLVPGLKDQLRSAICETLARRGCEAATVRKVVFSGEHIPTLRFSDEAEYARRAVCLGASDRDKPGYRYMEKMEAPSVVRLQTAPRWV